MPKFYAVTLSYTAIVKADSSEAAKELTRQEEREIVADSGDPSDISVDEEITSTAQLSKHGWDGTCYPYGDTDGNTRLNTYLPST